MEKITLAQLKGKYLEHICRLLLENAGYTILQEEPNRVIYRGSNRVIELYGRGTTHQIDLPYEFKYHVPFVNPIQVIGEVKYYTSQIQKQFIRAFIGVLSDITENHVVSHLTNLSGIKERHLTQGLFISASGFQIEAEKLAYAHNIKLITFAKNPVFKPILEKIDYLANLHFHEGIDSLSFSSLVELVHFFNDNIKTYFLATTATGHLMYFISNERFDFDTRIPNYQANITYSVDIKNDNYIQLTIDNRTFHSSLPESVYREFIEQNQIYGHAIRSKEHHFSPLTVYKLIEGKLNVFQIYYQARKELR